MGSSAEKRAEGPTLADVLAELREVRELLHTGGEKLWTLDDVAEYVGVHRDTARRMLAQPDAPKARQKRTSDKGTVHAPRYLADEIRAWYEVSPASARVRRRRAGSTRAAS